MSNKLKIQKSNGEFAYILPHQHEENLRRFRRIRRELPYKLVNTEPLPKIKKKIVEDYTEVKKEKKVKTKKIDGEVEFKEDINVED